MKVLLINQTHAPSGGANVVCLNTGRILEEHGLQVVYFSQSSINQETTSSSKYFYEGPKNVFERFIFDYYNWRAVRQLKKLITEEKPDIAHIHELGNISDSILPLLKKKHIPVVLTVHDYHLVCPVSHFLDKKGNSCEMCKDGHYCRCFRNACFKGNYLKSFLLTILFYYRRWFYPPFRYLNGVIFVSRFSQAKNIEHDKRFKAIKHKFIYNSSIENTICDNLVRGEYFLYFGRLSYEKGVETLIKAFGKLSNMKLKIVGNGPIKEDLMNMASGFNNIEFTGFKSGKELAEIIINSSFVVVPSICYENNPMAVVESYSFGKPVIGSESGAIPEIVTSKTGFLFEKNKVESLMISLLRANEISNIEYNRLSENAKDFFQKNFSDERYYSELMDFYMSLL